MSHRRRVSERAIRIELLVAQMQSDVGRTILSVKTRDGQDCPFYKQSNQRLSVAEFQTELKTVVEDAVVSVHAAAVVEIARGDLG